MMFENDLAPEPSPMAQLRRHLPIALVAFGVLAAFVALHTAAIGVVIAAGAHVAIGLAVLLFRHLRPSDGSDAQSGEKAEAEAQA